MKKEKVGLNQKIRKILSNPSKNLVIISILVIAVILVFSKGSLIAQITRKENVNQNSSPSLEKTQNVVLEIFTPPVFVKPSSPEEFKEGLEGQEIPLGAIIKTDPGARAQLLYPNHTVVRLGENSQIILSDFSQEPFNTKVIIEKGKIWSRIVKLLGGSSFKTETGNIVASIRGTSYGHESLANGNDLLIVTKNSMLGECLNETQRAQVETSQVAIFDCQSGKSPIIRYLTQQELSNDWFIFNNQQDKLLEDRFGKETYDDQSDLITATPIPTKTPTPTPKPTNTPTPQPSNTPVPTPTPTPQPQVTVININFSCDRICSGIIYGSEFNDDSAVWALSKSQLSAFPASSYQYISPTEMTASFNQLPKGEYYIQVINPDKSSATSTQTFSN